MVKVLILSAGDGARWNNHLGIPKQLIRINGETLFERMLRLLQKRGHFDIECITNDNRLNVIPCKFSQPTNYSWIVETLLSTKQLWKRRTIILLGDVFYTERAIARVVDLDENIAVFGRPRPSRFTGRNHGEIFAISFSETAAGTVIRTAEKTLWCAINGAFGNLWDFYHTLVGLPLNSNFIESNVFKVIDDFTDDFDTPQDYERTIDRYNVLASRNIVRKYIFSFLPSIKTPLYSLLSLVGLRNFKKMVKQKTEIRFLERRC